MNILILGGTGFIGHHVIEQLIRSRHTVTVFHRGMTNAIIPGEMKHIYGDRNRIADYREVLLDAEPEVVVDFTLSAGAQAEALMKTLRGVTRRVVAISSMDIYRACGVLHETESGELQSLPLTEDSELRTKAAYAPDQVRMMRNIFSWVNEEYDKIPVERVIMSDSELPGTVLRLPMVYGPADPLHRLYPVVKRILDGRRQIILPEDVARWRGPKGYVEDVAHAISIAATSESAALRVYNVAEADALTELEWAHLVAKELGWDGEFVVLPRERAPKHLVHHGNWAQHWVASSDRIRRELGYRELFTRSEAIRRTVAYERENAPQQVPGAQFDYGTEDEALRSYEAASVSS